MDETLAFDADENQGFTYIKKEVIDGEVYLLAPPLDWRHPVINQNLCAALRAKLKGQPCKAFVDGVGLDWHTDEDRNEKNKGDYIVPDVMVVCDTKLIKNGYYNGIPKFVAETLSKTTSKRDRSTKLKIYEKIGVSEYWVIGTRGLLDIYYLEDGKYELHETYELCTDKEDDYYNVDMPITLREFPQVTITMGDIFEDTYDE